MKAFPFRWLSVLLIVTFLISGCVPVPTTQPAATTPESTATWAQQQVLAWQDCVDVAYGRTPADYAVRAGKLFEANTGTWLTDQTIAIKGSYTCWVGPTSEWTHTSIQSVDYSKYTLGPVFGEAHTHLESARETPDQAARLQTLYGQGWLIEASHELANVFPVDKVTQYFLAGWDVGLPFNIYPDLASAAPPTPFENTGAGDTYNYDSFLRLFQSDPRVKLIDEVMNGPVWKNRNFPGHETLMGQFAAALATGNQIQGHMSMYTSFDDISAGASMHLYSDHENARGTDTISLGEEAWRKLTHGVTLIMRPADAEQIIPYLLEKDLKDWSKVTITTDDRAPDETIYEVGGSKDNIKRAIKAGLPLEIAWQAGSINPAKYARVDELEGSVDPGKFASFLVLTGDPTEFNLKAVWVNGIKAVEDNVFVADIPPMDWSAYTRSMNTGKLTEADFAVKATGNQATVALLSQFYFTPDYQTAVLPVVNGLVQPDRSQKIVKFSVIDRYHGKPSVANMFWTGVGPDETDAAFCETEAHDNHYAQCLSTSDAAALLAVNRLSELGGGYIFVQGGKVIAEVQLEVGGLMTAKPAQMTADNFRAFWKTLSTYHWFGDLTAEKRQRFATLTCDPWKWVLVIPFSGCSSGFVNVTTGECQPVVVQ